MFWPSTGNNFLHNLGRRILSSVFLFLVFIYLLIHLFLAVLGLFFFCCMQAFSSCGEQNLLYSYVAQAPHVAEHQL